MSKNNSELTNIILNKKNGQNGQKKIILIIILIILLIALIAVFSYINMSKKDDLKLPPEPAIVSNDISDVVPINNNMTSKPNKDDNLDISEKVETDNKNPKSEYREPIDAKNTNDDKEVAAILSSLNNVKATSNVKSTANSKKVVKDSISAKKYYVQVGAFSIFKPDQDFLNKIINNGFKFKLKRISNMTKVLIGPFKSRKEVKNKLPVIRAKIVSSAFLVQF